MRRIDHSLVKFTQGLVLDSLLILIAASITIDFVMAAQPMMENAWMCYGGLFVVLQGLRWGFVRWDQRNLERQIQQDFEKNQKE